MKRFIPLLIFAISIFCITNVDAQLPNIAVVSADVDTWEADVVAKLEETGFFESVALVDTESSTPDLTTLQSFDAIIVYTDNSPADATLLGDNIASYIESGGGVVMAHFTFLSSIQIGGSFATNYQMIQPASSNTGVLSMDTYDPNHPLMTGVSSFDGGTSSYHSPGVTIINGGYTVASWSNGEPLVVAGEVFGPEGVRRVDLNFFPPSSDAQSDFWTSTTDGAIIMGNSLLWVAGYDRPGNQTLYASSGTISDGSNQFDYINDETASWLIQPSGATSITIDFTSVEMQDCCDYVRVYDGPDNLTTPVLEINGRESLGEITLPQTFTSTGGSMFVEFTSDLSITYGGWSATYITDGFTSIGLTGDQSLFSDPSDHWNAEIGLTQPDPTGQPHLWTTNLTLNNGNVKFRAGGSWDTNWGGDYFPFGKGTQNSADIPVTAGTYNISFNDLTGEYRFTSTTLASSVLNNLHGGSSKNWTLVDTGLAIGVGLYAGSFDWWSFGDGGVVSFAERPCVSDDILTFNSTGVLDFNSNNTIHLDPESVGGWNDALGADQCHDESESGLFVAFDASDVSAFANGGNYTFTYNGTTNALVVNGDGHYIGLPNKTNGGDNPFPVSSKEYIVTSIDAGIMQLVMPVNGGEYYWTFNLMYGTGALVADFPFNGNANDESGNGNDGTVNGAVLTTDRFGNASSAYNFNSTSSLEYITGSSSLGLSGSISISAWINPNSLGSPGVSEDHIIINERDQVTPDFLGDMNWQFGVEDQAVVFWKSDASANKGSVSSNQVLQAGVWQHVVATYDDGTGDVVLYVDGSPEGSGVFGTGMNTQNYPWLIGASFTDDTFGDRWNGGIDDVKIYRKALSQSEVLNLFDETNSTGSDAVPEEERLALIALYNATNGDSWFDNTNWNSGTVDTWYGITVTGGRVTEISLPDNNLFGSIPSDIGDLAALQNLYLYNNDFSGSSLPVEMNNLVSLVELDVYNTALTGDIPDMSALTNLTLFSLSSNEFTGTIPSWLGSLTNLTDVYLWGNNLTGSIPTELGNLTNMDWLNLSSNNLSGSIPSSLGNLSFMTYLSMGNNSLTGSIPSSFSNLTSLDVLALGGNQLTDNIPAFIGDALNLSELYLWGNNFSGPIPTNLGNLTALTHLYLSSNQLSGPIPVEFNNLTELVELVIGSNQLTGTIPDLSNLQNLVIFSVFENNLSGDVPDFFNQFTFLEVFSVRDNNFENMVDLSGLSTLTDIRAEGNRFTFEDILPNIGVAANGYTYSPQQAAGKVKNIKVPVGSDFTIELRFDENVSGSNYDWYRDGSYMESTSEPSLTVTNFQSNQTWYAEINNTTALDLTLVTSDINLIVSDLCASSAEDDFDTRIDRVVFGDLDHTSSVGGDGICATYSNFTDISTDVFVGQSVDIGFQIGTCGTLYDRGVKMYVDWDQDGSFDESTEFIGQGGVLTDVDPDEFFFFTEDFYTIPEVPSGNYTLRVVAQEVSDMSEISGCGLYAYGETEDYTINVVDARSDLIVSLSSVSPLSMFNSDTPIDDEDDIAITLSVTNIGEYASISSANGIGFYASDDNVWDGPESETELDIISLNSVDAGSSSTITDITIKPPSIDGSFYLIALVNPLLEIPETDESNNTAILQQPIFVEIGTPADSEPPVVSLQNPSSNPYIMGTGGVTISAEITDDVGIDFVLLAYGRISEITDDFDQDQYEVIIPEEITPGIYSHTLTDADFDDIGVQYYFGAGDAAGNIGLSDPLPAKISVEFPERDIRLTDPQPVSNISDPQETDYRIFSVPVRNATINSVLGVDFVDKEQWRVWQYSGGNSELTSTGSSLSAGKGYWLIYVDGSGVDLFFGGVAVDASNSNPFVMNLSSGINLIGNPYRFPISWQQVIDHNINEGIILDGDVSGLTFYRGGFSSAGNATLGETEGAFIQSNEPFALEIPFSAQTTRMGTNFRTVRNALDKDSWEVGIDLSNENTFYNVASVGMDPGAMEGMDKFDRKAMPYLFNYLEFNSRNDEFEDRISGDFVKTSENQIWEFEATTSFDPSEAVLSWDNTYFGENDRELYLYDVAEERIVNMREQQEYHFYLENKRSFKIVYGSEEFIESALTPQRFTLGHAYPNPFTNQTRIPFSLSDESGEYKVRMTVYNTVGEVVKVLADEEFASGFYALDWDGTNRNGQQVSEGMYIYKLSITDENGSKDLTGKLIYGR